LPDFGIAEGGWIMGLLNKNHAECRSVLAQLDDVAAGAATLPELLDALPGRLRQHAQACSNCRAAAENLLATRSMLSAVPSSADLGGPWFASRVMAAIAARKAELARVVDTWTLLPKLAVHLTWASSLALLLASAWLYQKPASVPPQTSARVVATDITGEPVVDSSTLPSNDDVLVSLAEKPQ
jgi:hypothetical protein